MSYFPFMIELNNKKCLIAGGGTVAYRKVCSMLEFGAVVTVVSPEFCPELIAMAGKGEDISGEAAATEDIADQVNDQANNQANKGKKLALIQRCVSPEDIEGAFVVIMATDDEKVNHEMAELCRQRNILVNVVDVKEDCGFYFPAIIKDKEVVISVSTGGQSPVLAGTIKRNIASHLGKKYGDIAEQMGELREQIKSEIDDEEDRKRVFQQMVRSLIDEC